jgi:phosphate starvation-inducible protein PhoH and related proteins
MGKKKTTNGVPNTSLKLVPVKPLTTAQRLTFDEFRDDQHLFLHGVAGTGKTFLALYLALEQVMSGLGVENHVVIVRSAVPSRDIGFLPGNTKDKIREFEAPYISICADLFGRGDAYSILSQKKIVEFMSTSFVRGITLNESIIIIDEIQNFTFQEASSILTRIGKNCRVIVAGDFRQSDLKPQQRDDLTKLMNIVQSMESFSFIEFGLNDIVRSGFVREFLTACIKFEDQCKKGSYMNGQSREPLHAQTPHRVGSI